APLADVVDAALRGPVPTPKIRIRTREGRVISNVPDAGQDHVAAASSERPRSARGRRPMSVFPHGVSRSYVEQSIRDLDLPVRVLGNLDGAEFVITLKNYYRRRPDSLRQAEVAGIPVHVLKSNTVTQVKEALARIYGPDREDAVT